MTKFVLSFLLTGFLFLCFSQNKQDNDPALQLKDYRDAEKIFQLAEKRSSEAGENEKLQAAADEIYSRALISFKKVATVAKKSGNDSLSFFARCRAGLISYYLNDQDAARSAYLAAIELKQRLSSVPDSFLFIPLLYTGSIYYTQNRFDSALFFYKKAETVNDSYKRPLTGSGRLYNRLGVIYYENGNYRQARNYFEKAITITDPSDTSLLINYKINIASLLVKLEEYPKARSVYESLLPYNVHTNEINHNLGIINQKLKDFNKAISYFKKVNYTGSNKNIDLYYNFAVTWSGLHEEDSSAFYIQRAIAENTKWNGHKKNVPDGLILNFQAGQLMSQHKYSQAIELYQQAIMQFDAYFNEEDIFKNPEEFSAVFSYINLFNTLVAKAAAMELLYKELNDIKFLQSSLDAYRSAFKLADYVEKTYDSDEARLFLGKIKYSVHSKPIDICLLLYELTQKKEYLEAAYHFDQQNKASILSLNVQENELRADNKSHKDLFEKEALLKTAITRLTLKSGQLTDSLQLQSNDSSIRDYEIQLGKLQEKMNNDPAYHSRYFSSQIPGIHELQGKLDNTTAILSWHLSNKEIIVFMITGNQFTFNKSAFNADLFNDLDSLKISLHNTSSEQRYNGGVFSSSLYKSLIEPIGSKLYNIKRLIIIPDDELNYLPFEALMDKKGRYLVEKFSIQYQYSTALLGKDIMTTKAKGTLAFAPFVSKSYSDPAGTNFAVLPASKEETKDLQGKILTDSSASKNNFLRSANHYGIIHLATHASVDNETPLRSFISFFPVPGSNADDYKLYAQEIYDLNLDSTQLVILSACETGTGKLVKGEGLMSLSRAFAYAGCPNIITSLWKAEDKTTAFITQKLHHYLAKGYSKDKALQQAKLDLLKSDEIDPRFKTANYWAHLIFIGNYDTEGKPSPRWWIVFCILIIAVIYFFSKRKA